MNESLCVGFLLCGVSLIVLYLYFSHIIFRERPTLIFLRAVRSGMGNIITNFYLTLAGDDKQPH